MILVRLFRSRTAHIAKIEGEVFRTRCGQTFSLQVARAPLRKMRYCRKCGRLEEFKALVGKTVLFWRYLA